LGKDQRTEAPTGTGQGRRPVTDPLSKAAQNLVVLQERKFTGTVVIRLELYEGGVTATRFNTDQQIYPELQKKEKRIKNSSH
jgi:hypothetical protein